MFFTKQLPSFDFSLYDFTIDVNHLTNRLDIVVRLFSNRSKITSKSCTRAAGECVIDVFFTTFWRLL